MAILPIDSTSAIVGFVALVLGIWYLKSKRNNFPPGPMPWPLVGNLISIGRAKSPKEAFYEYQKQYGNIFTVYFGSHPVIVLCGHRMIRDALVSNADVFSARPTFLSTFVHVYKNKGIMWDPHNWKANRKSSLVTLKDFGLGKHSLEERVCEEARSLCELFGEKEGEEVDVHQFLSKAFSNVICTVVFGQRFEYDDPKFTKMMDLMDYAFSASGNTALILDYIPQLMIIPRLRAQFEELLKTNDGLNEFIKENIEEHKRSFDSENLRDFIDLYLKDPTNEDTAMSIIKELFLAGTETSGTTLTWGFLLMAKYPEVQKKCHQEIKEVIGSSRGPVNSDRGSLPFTEAALLEIQRFCTIGPMALPHAVAEDTIFAGYELKKNSIVIPFIDSSHHDPEVWPDHDEFRPERWLDESGKLDGKNAAFMPFSVGRRACLGEQLARSELFIMFISVLQRFEFGPTPGKTVSLDGHLGISFAPKNPKIMYKKKDL